MLGSLGLLCAVPVAGFSGAVLAATVATEVHALVTLVRGEQRLSIGPGRELRPGDVVETGPASAIVLQFDRGSSIRIGAGSRVALGAVHGNATTPVDSLLQRVLLVAGVMRVVSVRGGEGILLQGGGFVAAIRESIADVAVGAGGGICSVEGLVTVSRGTRVATLEGPDDCIRLDDAVSDPGPAGPATLSPPPAPAVEVAGAPGNAVRVHGPATVPDKPAADSTVARRALPAAPVASPDAAGRDAGWWVNVASPTSRKEADAIASAVRRAGHPVSVHPVLVRERQHYRVRVGAYPTRDEASRVAEALGTRFARASPWIGRE
jgi:cell division septation protein DedD